MRNLRTTTDTATPEETPLAGQGDQLHRLARNAEGSDSAEILPHHGNPERFFPGILARVNAVDDKVIQQGFQCPYACDEKNSGNEPEKIQRRKGLD